MEVITSINLGWIESYYQGRNSKEELDKDLGNICQLLEGRLVYDQGDQQLRVGGGLVAWWGRYSLGVGDWTLRYIRPR